jgi:hypothetical protein
MPSGEVSPVGSHHKCRILDYNHMQQMYICTFEKNVIKEKIFKTDRFESGTARSRHS